MNMRTFAVWSMIAVLGLCAGVGLADDMYWQGAGTGGNTATDPADPTTQWDNPANWDSGIVPGTGDYDNAYLTFENAGYTYVGSAQISTVRIEGTSSEAALRIIEGAAPFDVRYHFYVGLNSTGTVIQTGASDVRVGFLRLGYNAGANGTYEMFSGSLTVDDDGERIGEKGVARFIQHGGTHTIIGGLVLESEYTGSATFELHGGSLEVFPDDPYEGAVGMQGYAEEARFIHTGGDHTVHGNLILGGYARYSQTGGNLNVQLLLDMSDSRNNTFELGVAGSVTSWQTIVGGIGEKRFTQSGGSHTTSYLVVGDEYWDPFEPGDAMYTLSAGELSAGGESVGFKGCAVFNQTGGTHTVAGELQIGFTGNSWGTFNLNSGSLVAGTLRVGDFLGSGALNINSAATYVEVQNALVLGANGMFTAVDGVVIHMTGSSFENRQTNPAQSSGLIRVEMIFEGGSAETDDFEVAGKDLGINMAGFDYNFNFGALTLGGADVGRVRLVDLYDNQPGWEGQQALYVEDLILGPNAWLDLNGLNLYYLNASIDPTAVVDFNGGNLIRVPEPAMLSLLCVGGLAVMRSSWRGRKGMQKTM